MSKKPSQPTAETDGQFSVDETTWRGFFSMAAFDYNELNVQKSHD